MFIARNHRSDYDAQYMSISWKVYTPPLRHVIFTNWE